MNNLHETILVVEDDAQIRNFICFALQGDGYVCRTADTAAEAMRLLAAEPVDLMLLDLGLPDLDGTLRAGSGSGKGVAAGHRRG